jgi:hypothetical protein
MLGHGAETNLTFIQKRISNYNNGADAGFNEQILYANSCDLKQKEMSSKNGNHTHSGRLVKVVISSREAPRPEHFNLPLPRNMID